MRVLHVVGGMNRGGVETWLMHVLRHSDRSRLQIDFFVHTDQSCAYDAEIVALGGRIFRSMGPSNPYAYARALRQVLRNEGPYDAIHSHVHHFSGFVLWVALLEGVPVRLAHSHSDTTLLEAQSPVWRRLYLSCMQRAIYRYASSGLAASRKAAAALFGDDWKQDPRWAIHYCGIDLDSYDPSRTERDKVLHELSLPEDAVVVGHVGRFVEVKNHRFLVSVASALVNLVPNAYFILVGDGPLRNEMERLVAERGLGERFIFTGLRNDVSRLVTAMDLFLFPSLLEGLPLVLIEAQAAGLPCVISDAVTPEVVVVPGLVRSLALSASPMLWAQTLAESYHTGAGASKLEALAILKRSPFHIDASVHALEKLYARNS